MPKRKATKSKAATGSTDLENQNATPELSPKKSKILNSNVSNSQSDSDSLIMSTSSVAAKVIKAAQTAGSRKLLGAHVSAAGGLSNAASNAAEIGCRSFALFIRNQRQWTAKPMDDQTVDDFKQACQLFGYNARHILPHGSYLMNPGAPDDEKLKKTRDALIDEVLRCERLAIQMYNFHPGSTCGQISSSDCIKRVSETINIVHSASSSVKLVVETMAGQGSTIGGKFSELADIIAGVKDKTRVGICLDTCHIFAAGYDIRSEAAYKKTMDEFAKHDLFSYLCAVHLNDSKGACDSHLDRHENIGKGQIGMKGFGHLMRDVRFDDIPMVLETPEGDYAREMQKLYDLQLK